MKTIKCCLVGWNWKIKDFKMQMGNFETTTVKNSCAIVKNQSSDFYNKVVSRDERSSHLHNVA